MESRPILTFNQDRAMPKPKKPPVDLPDKSQGELKIEYNLYEGGPFQSLDTNMPVEYSVFEEDIRTQVLQSFRWKRYLRGNPYRQGSQPNYTVIFNGGLAIPVHMVKFTDGSIWNSTTRKLTNDRPQGDEGLDSDVPEVHGE